MNENRKNLGIDLAYAAFDDIPKAKSDANKIVGLVKKNGRITGYQLDNGSIVSKEEWASITTTGDYFKCLNGLTFEKLVKIAVETNNFSRKTSVYYKKEENKP